MRKKAIRPSAAVMAISLLGFLTTSCDNLTARRHDSTTARLTVSTSIPVMAYFVDNISCGYVDVNVMVPQSAGHSTYTPRPSQMVALSNSTAYIAIGPLDFEQTWKDRFTSSAPTMKWVDVSRGIELVKGHSHNDGHEQCHNDEADPHYFTSPRQSRIMAKNIAKALIDIIPQKANDIDSALVALTAKIDKLDSTLAYATANAHCRTFMIYHPALTYMARDYGFTQIAIEKDGNAPSAQAYTDDTKKAQEAGAQVVFVQKGYDPQKAASAAEAIGGHVVEIEPESYEWELTMTKIIDALR